MDRLVRFSLFGQEFSFYTDAPEEEVAKIITFIRKELDADEGGPSTFPSNKMVVLGCLRMAAKYIELEKEFAEFRKEQGLAIDKLIAKVSTEVE